MPQRYAAGSSPRVSAGPAFGLRRHRAVISELALGLMSVGHPVELFASDVCGRGGAGDRRARPERLPVHRRGGDDSQARRRRVARPVGLPSERRRALLGAAVHRSSCRPLPAGVKPPPARSGALRRPEARTSQSSARVTDEGRSDASNKQLLRGDRAPLAGVVPSDVGFRLSVHPLPRGSNVQ